MLSLETLGKEKDKLKLRYSRFCKATSLLHEVSGSWRFDVRKWSPRWITRPPWWSCSVTYSFFDFGNIKKYRNNPQAFSNRFQSLSKKEFDKALASIHREIERIQIEKEAKLMDKCIK